MIFLNCDIKIIKIAAYQIIWKSGFMLASVEITNNIKNISRLFLLFHFESVNENAKTESIKKVIISVRANAV